MSNGTAIQMNFRIMNFHFFSITLGHYNYETNVFRYLVASRKQHWFHSCMKRTNQVKDIMIWIPFQRSGILRSLETVDKR